ASPLPEDDPAPAAPGAATPPPEPSPPAVSPPPPLALEPPTLASAPASPARWYRSPIARWTAAGVAVAALGAGLTLLAIDDACLQRGANPCGRNYDTAAGGWALAAAGLAVGGGAFYLFWTAMPAEGPRVAIGWSGHF